MRAKAATKDGAQVSRVTRGLQGAQGTRSRAAREGSALQPGQQPGAGDARPPDRLHTDGQHLGPDVGPRARFK